MAVVPSPELSALLDSLVLAASEGALCLGSPTWFVADELAARGVSVEHAEGDWPSIQLPRRFGVVLVGPDAGATPERQRAALHCAIQHVEPGGHVVSTFDDLLAEEFALVDVRCIDVEGIVLRAHRRTSRRTIHDVVFEARAAITRLTPVELAARLAGDDAPLVVDTRTPTDRGRWGVIPGSIHAPRTVLEWHLDPANGYRHPLITSLDQPIVVVCNGGYSSSLAAANLVAIGFTDVADLIGGHHAWRLAGLPVATPDHSHLDL